MPNDVPDYSNTTVVSSGSLIISSGSVAINAGQAGTNVSIDTPPRHNADLTVTSGTNGATITVTPGSDATGALVLVNIPKGSGTPNWVTCNVTGTDTGFLYASVQGDAGKGFSLLFGVDVTRESSFTVQVILVGTATATYVAAGVYDILASGVTEIAVNPEQPVPVKMGPGAITTFTAAVFQNGGGAGAATVNIGTISTLLGTNQRYLRSCFISASWTAGVASGATVLQLKGHTSGTIIQIAEIAHVAATAGSQGYSRDFQASQFDFIKAFNATDTQVDVQLVIPAAVVAFAGVTAIT